jgi:YVTN family beta-propeller protein
MVLTGQLTNVLLGVHLGTLALPDGRILLSDDATKEILALRIDDAGAPTIVGRVAATLGRRAVWGSVDSRLRFFAVASEVEGSDEQVVNVIDLATFENHEARVRMTGEGEAHPFLAGRPLALFVGLGGDVEAYRDGLVPLSRTPIDPGSHGPVVSPKTGRLAISTAAGLNVIDANDCLRRELATCGRVNVAWDVDGRTGGQNFRPRLAADGVTVLGAVAGPVPSPADWADTPQDVHAVNLWTHGAHRFRLGNGVVPRFALSEPFAVFVTVHPYADELHLVDVDPRSPRYLRRVGSVELERMSNGPVGGQPTAGREARFVAVTPDGRYAFTTHGGDGKISVVDTATLSVTQLAVPTALSGGGYIVAVQPGTELFDLFAR